MELFEKGKKDPLSPGTHDWHLARLYLGQTGGGVLCRGKAPRRRRGLDYGHKEFLNTKASKIPVAGRGEFVGRRRQIQGILKEFNSPGYAGVLVHGFGRQGKSSLAARIAHRMPDHCLVVVYGNYDALSILEAIEYFAGTSELNNLLGPQKAGAGSSPDQLFILLKEILEGPFPPLLLVIDDLEQVLEDPQTGQLHRVNSDVLDTLRAVIAAFDATGGKTGSRLLITSRYRFTLPYKGRDLATRLFQLHLPPMEEYEGRKQASAKERQLGEAGERVDVERRERCIGAARGNPGLQDLLFGLCLKAPDACDQALEAVEAFAGQGKAPDRETLLEFIRDLAVDRLLGLLSQSEKDLLRASTLFSIPLPLETLMLLARELGIKEGEVFGDRLFGFGLWEPFEDIVNPGKTAAAIHGLVRGKAGKLTGAEAKEIAGLVVQDLFERWGGKDSSKRTYAADIQLAGLALPAKNIIVLAETAKDAVRGLEKQFQYRSAAKLAGEAIETLDNANVGVSAGLLRAGAEISQRIGDMKNARTFIQRAIETLFSAKETEDYAYALISHGRMLVDSGEPDEALKVLQEAKDRLQSDRFLKERSIVLGDIARILVDKGEVEEALKLHQEELRAYEELGDIDSKAVTLWDLANIELQCESFQTAFDYLSESYDILLKLGRLDGICWVGFDLGKLLCRAGYTETSLKILERSRDGFRKLGQENLAQQTQQLMDTFSKNQTGTTAQK
jgi:tetratricopeptide (TPR) repeat protein